MMEQDRGQGNPAFLCFLCLKVKVEGDDDLQQGNFMRLLKFASVAGITDEEMEEVLSGSEFLLCGACNSQLNVFIEELDNPIYDSEVDPTIEEMGGIIDAITEILWTIKVSQERLGSSPLLIVGGGVTVDDHSIIKKMIDLRGKMLAKGADLLRSVYQPSSSTDIETVKTEAESGAVTHQPAEFDQAECTFNRPYIKIEVVREGSSSSSSPMEEDGDHSAGLGNPTAPSSRYPSSSDLEQHGHGSTDNIPPFVKHEIVEDEGSSSPPPLRNGAPADDEEESIGTGENPGPTSLVRSTSVEQRRSTIWDGRVGPGDDDFTLSRRLLENVIFELKKEEESALACRNGGGSPEFPDEQQSRESRYDELRVPPIRPWFEGVVVKVEPVDNPPASSAPSVDEVGSALAVDRSSVESQGNFNEGRPNAGPSVVHGPTSEEEGTVETRSEIQVVFQSSELMRPLPPHQGELSSSSFLQTETGSFASRPVPAAENNVPRELRRSQRRKVHQCPLCRNGAQASSDALWRHIRNCHPEQLCLNRNSLVSSTLYSSTGQWSLSTSFNPSASGRRQSSSTDSINRRSRRQRNLGTSSDRYFLRPRRNVVPANSNPPTSRR